MRARTHTQTEINFTTFKGNLEFNFPAAATADSLGSDVHSLHCSISKGPGISEMLVSPLGPVDWVLSKVLCRQLSSVR